MSTDDGRPEAAVPSFGDLFEDSEPSTEAPATAAAPSVVQEPSSYDGVSAGTGEVRAVVQEPDEEPDVPVQPAGIAGFEHVEEPDHEPVATPVPRGSVTVPPAVREPEYMDVVPPVIATAAPAVTGRLYRSSGAEGPQTDGAIPAIDPEYLAARDAERAAAEAAAAKAAAAKPAKAAKAPKDAAVQGGSGLTWSGVVVVVILGTVLVAFADALINNSLGILTGIALLVSSVYCALLVRPADIWAAAIIPPLAFLAAALTAGQLTLDNAGSLVVREGYMLLKTLAQNAPWIVGTTLICFVIVIVRRRRAAPHA